MVELTRCSYLIIGSYTKILKTSITNQSHNQQSENGAAKRTGNVVPGWAWTTHEIISVTVVKTQHYKSLSQKLRVVQQMSTRTTSNIPVPRRLFDGSRKK